MRLATIVLVLTTTALARASDSDDIARLVDGQFEMFGDLGLSGKVFATDAQIVSTSGLGTPDNRGFRVAYNREQYAGHDDKNRQIVISRDGKSAWASITTKVTILPQNEHSRDDDWRVSDVLVKSPTGWVVAASVWTQPQGNAAVNKDAKAGKLAARTALEGDAGDAGLRAAFDKLATDGLDATATARKDLVAIGSGPGERTVGGSVLAKAWTAAWKGHLTITSSIARLAPSHTTGWVVTNVELAKGTGKSAYKIPFLVFCVFDKTTSGEWNLVHMVFAV